MVLDMLGVKDNIGHTIVQKSSVFLKKYRGVVDSPLLLALR
jgi:hypothetical protein